MRERCLPAIVLFLLILPSALPASAEERGTVRTIRQTFPVTGIERLALDLSVGEARILGEERGDIQAVFELRCKPKRKRCADRARDVTLEGSTRSGRLALELRGFHGRARRDLTFSGVVRIPAGIALGIDMGVGELTIEGLTGDVDAELGVGEMNLRLPFDAIRSVSLAAGIGETSLHLPVGRHTSERSHLVGSETDWREGPGQANLDAEVGVGEVNVRLD